MRHQLPQEYQRNRSRDVGADQKEGLVKVSWIFILDQASGQIHWRCGICGDEGIVSGWEGLIWDMLDTDGLVH